MKLLIVFAAVLAVALAGRLDDNDIQIHRLAKLADQLEKRIREMDVSVDLDALSDRVEALTGNGCRDGEQRCGNGIGCYSSLLECDGESDCDDGSDEAGCPRV